MGREKDEKLRREEAARGRMKREALVCGICGEPAPRSHPKWGRLCDCHVHVMKKDD